jgi:hypothetical protein
MYRAMKRWIDAAAGIGALLQVIMKTIAQFGVPACPAAWWSERERYHQA